MADLSEKDLYFGRCLDSISTGIPILKNWPGCYVRANWLTLMKSPPTWCNPKIGESSFSFSGMGIPFTFVTSDSGRTYRSLTIS